jgi:hypothetical protein
MHSDQEIGRQTDDRIRNRDVFVEALFSLLVGYIL